MQNAGTADGSLPDSKNLMQAAEAQVKSLIDAHGEAYLQEMLSGFVKKVNRIAELNHLLAERSTETQENEYTETVQKIIRATHDYYNFIGLLPEDMRQFFLMIGGTDGGISFQSLSGLGIQMEGELAISPSPLFTAQSIRPKNYIMQIDAITNQLAFLGGQTELRVGRRRNQPVTTTVTLDMPDHMRIEGGAQLSTYDKSILNGVTSLLESGNTVFSIPMLYHAMTGKQNPTVDEGLYEELTAKLEKMRRMMLTIDISQEIDAQYITDQNGETVELRDLELEGYLLPLNKVSGVVNGKRTELYQIIQHPPLYSYSKIRRQLASVEISLLGAPVNNNSTTIPLKTYLLQRIEMMKNERNNISQHKILYESIYQELGANEANKTKKLRIRSYTTTILEYLVSRRYIASYVEYKKGRSIAGVDIYL